MAGELARRLVPDELWEQVEPLIPAPRTRPQGGGRNRADNRAVFTAIAFVLTSNCPWRSLPPVFGVKPPTVHRRFAEWAALGLWQRLHDQALISFGSGPEVDWTRALASSVELRTRAEQAQPESADIVTFAGRGHDQQPVSRGSARAGEIDGIAQDYTRSGRFPSS